MRRTRSRLLVGPQCGRSRAPGVMTEKYTAPETIVVTSEGVHG